MTGENGAPKPPDQIAQAISATNDDGQTVAMDQYQVTISSTGRPALIVVPLDASDGELAELAGLILTSILSTMRARRAAKQSPLAIARSLPSGLSRH